MVGMKKGLSVLLALVLLLCGAARAEEAVTSLTYAIFPYLPDPGTIRS